MTWDVWYAIELTAALELGIPPMTGGALDQTESFMAASRMIRSEQNHWQQEEMQWRKANTTSRSS